MYRSGDYLVICDICGFRKYASECRMQWDNLFVCADTCWSPKHPHHTQPSGNHEKQSVKPSRPEKEDKFITDKITADDL